MGNQWSHPGRLVVEPVAELEEGMDFRRPEYRREVFHRFYEFHLRHRAHPGAVYYLMPYLRERLGWDPEEALWFAFLNGHTQNPVTSYIIHRRFPQPKAGTVLELEEWYQANYVRLAVDTDRRHHKPMFGQAAGYYVTVTDGDQAGYWAYQAGMGFAGIWAAATRIPSFGRLSAFSYAEYLRIMGVAFDCDTLMLDDIPGSRSHRNGLAKVCGRDDLDYHPASNPSFTGRYEPAVLEWLTAEGEYLLAEAHERAQGQPWAADVSYFTLESALCTYKSWHRPNRRYPNVYNDMGYDRIRAAQEAWPEEDLGIFWAARAKSLPAYLLLECMPHDPGVRPLKQNWYREHGCPPMMHRDWPCFRNDLNDDIEAGRLPERRDR